MTQKPRILARNPVICGIELKQKEKHFKGLYEGARAPFRFIIWSYENQISGNVFWGSSVSNFNPMALIEGEERLPTAFSSLHPIFHNEDSALEHMETAMSEHVLEMLKGLRTWMDYEQGLQNGR